jgi:hypothetical protein
MTLSIRKPAPAASNVGGLNVAVNSTIAFRVEIFTPTERFKPNRPFRTRVKW